MASLDDVNAVCARTGRGSVCHCGARDAGTQSHPICATTRHKFGTEEAWCEMALTSSLTQPGW